MGVEFIEQRSLVKGDFGIDPIQSKHRASVAHNDTLYSKYHDHRIIFLVELVD